MRGRSGSVGSSKPSLVPVRVRVKKFQNSRNVTSFRNGRNVALFRNGRKVASFHNSRKVALFRNVASFWNGRNLDLFGYELKRERTGTLSRSGTVYARTFRISWNVEHVVPTVGTVPVRFRGRNRTN